MSLKRDFRKYNFWYLSHDRIDQLLSLYNVPAESLRFMNRKIDELKDKLNELQPIDIEQDLLQIINHTDQQIPIYTLDMFTNISDTEINNFAEFLNIVYYRKLGHDQPEENLRVINKIILELASRHWLSLDDYNGKIKVGKVNVDNNQQIAMEYGIRSIPSLLIFKNGTIVNQIVGSVQKDSITKLLDEAL